MKIFKSTVIVAATLLLTSASTFAQTATGTPMEGNGAGKMSTETTKDPSMMKKDGTMMKKDGMTSGSMEKGGMTEGKSDKMAK